jgi:hypothetical protein
MLLMIVTLLGNRIPGCIPPPNCNFVPVHQSPLISSSLPFPAYGPHLHSMTLAFFVLCMGEKVIFLCLAYFTSRFTHIATNDKSSFTLWLNSIPLCVYTTLSLFIHLVIDAEVDCISWLLWIMLQRTWKCRCLSFHFTFILFQVLE